MHRVIAVLLAASPTLVAVGCGESAARDRSPGDGP